MTSTQLSFSDSLLQPLQLSHILYSFSGTSCSGKIKHAKRVHKEERKESNSQASSDFREDLPLVLSTLEDDSVSKALSLDSNLSEVVEAVAKGDIKPLADKKRWGQREGPQPQDRGQSVGRGPVVQEAEPPTAVSHHP